MSINNKINDVHIVTVATESKYYFDYLKKTCSQNGIELTVLGFGEKWKGFAWRLQLMIDYLKSINPNDIVCFVDGYDVICIRDLKELKKVFENIISREKCKIIVSQDAKNLTFIESLQIKFLFDTCKNESINAGTYIGYAKDLIEIINNTYNIEQDESRDDQILLTKYCNLKSQDFYIDTNNEIFVVLFNKFGQIDDFINIHENKNYFNNSQPFFVHAPCATYLDGILIKLGYCNKNDIKIQKINKELVIDFDEKKKKLTWHFVKEKKELILQIILIIIIIIFIICRYKKNK